MQVQTLVSPSAPSSVLSSRRAWLRTTGSLSAVAIAMLGANEALAQGMAADPSKDVGILNVALGLEHEAINAYQLAHELVPLVVCCRREEYLAESTRVALQQAVVVQPLAPEQIDAYLSSTGGQLGHRAHGQLKPRAPIPQHV